MVSIDLSGATAAALSDARRKTGLSTDALISEALALVLIQTQTQRRNGGIEKSGQVRDEAVSQTNSTKTSKKLSHSTSPGDENQNCLPNPSKRQKQAKQPVKQDDLFD
jgi:hypothetical protein